MHDQTAVKNEGIEDLLRQHPTVNVTVDAGYQELAKAFDDQVPPGPRPARKPEKNVPAEEVAAYEQARKQQSSERLCVEHANAGYTRWPPLQRWTGRRESTPRPIWRSPGWSQTGAARR